MSEKPIDNKERTAARREANAAALEKIRLYTLTELEPVLGVTHRTLQTYVKTGRLKAVKIGHRWRVTQENLDAFLNGAERNT